MAEQLAAELLERLYQSERTNLDLNIQLHATRAELKAAKDDAVAAHDGYNESFLSTAIKIVNEKNKVAELEKTIQDLKDQEPSDLATEVAELKAMLKTALEQLGDLKTAPGSTAGIESDYFPRMGDSKGPRRSNLQTPPPPIMPPIAAGYRGTATGSGSRTGYMPG
ncbi:hypothetical protein LTR27_011380 [Elasticomyces elasticus]|nr:hypothetical protein LTR27_011380 [Elasticomyces elasticus]